MVWYPLYLTHDEYLIRSKIFCTLCVQLLPLPFVTYGSAPAHMFTHSYSHTYTHNNLLKERLSYSACVPISSTIKCQVLVYTHINIMHYYTYLLSYQLIRCCIVHLCYIRRKYFHSYWLIFIHSLKHFTKSTFTKTCSWTKERGEIE